jgi:hypothetical protein
MKLRLDVLVVGVVAAMVVLGCSKPYHRQYLGAVAANHAKVQTLQLGMTRAEVEGLMGSGVLVDYKRIKLRNPHRYETMRVSDRKTVEILYYVTEGYVWNAPERSTLTPLIFENGRLAGWGWPFIENDKSKYVSGPAVAPDGR